MIRHDGDKENLNIEHGFISIGGHEHHDKENNTTALVPWWVSRFTSGSAE